MARRRAPAVAQVAGERQRRRRGRRRRRATRAFRSSDRTVAPRRRQRRETVRLARARAAEEEEGACRRAPPRPSAGSRRRPRAGGRRRGRGGSSRRCRRRAPPLPSRGPQRARERRPPVEPCGDQPRPARRTEAGGEAPCRARTPSRACRRSRKSVGAARKTAAATAPGTESGSRRPAKRSPTMAACASDSPVNRYGPPGRSSTATRGPHASPLGRAGRGRVGRGSVRRSSSGGEPPEDQGGEAGERPQAVRGGHRRGGTAHHPLRRHREVVRGVAVAAGDVGEPAAVEAIAQQTVEDERPSGPAKASRSPGQ